jgi:hypothetical protein
MSCDYDGNMELSPFNQSFCGRITDEEFPLKPYKCQPPNRKIKDAVSLAHGREMEMLERAMERNQDDDAIQVCISNPFIHHTSSADFVGLNSRLEI